MATEAPKATAKKTATAKAGATKAWGHQGDGPQSSCSTGQSSQSTRPHQGDTLPLPQTPAPPWQ